MRIHAAVLAAGRGERLRVETPKPLFPLLGRPMIGWALDALRGAGISAPVVVTGPGLKPVLAKLLGRRARFAVQPVPRGTGDAVARVRPLAGEGVLVVINADTPLFEPVHIRSLLAARAKENALVAFATAVVPDPSGLGRVLRDPSGAVANIVEEAEAAPEIRAVREVNAGLYAFRTPAIFDLLADIAPVGARRERYLTRAVELALSRGETVATVAVPPEAAGGVNTLAEAALAQAVLQTRVLASLMAAGVMIEDPAGVTVEPGVRVGAGTRLLPGVRLSGATRIGAGCVVGPQAVLRDATLGNRVVVRASVVTGSRIEDGAEIGPYAHVRPGCVVRRGAHVGTHAELVRTTLGAGARMHHFSYLGDADVGAGANIGAGAVSANYDGSRKWPTRIGARAFIGSGAVLVAPARVGDRAVVGAGAVVPARRPVRPGTVVAGVPARPMKRKGQGGTRAQ